MSKKYKKRSILYNIFLKYSNYINIFNSNVSKYNHEDIIYNFKSEYKISRNFEYYFQPQNCVI